MSVRHKRQVKKYLSERHDYLISDPHARVCLRIKQVPVFCPHDLSISSFVVCLNVLVEHRYTLSLSNRVSKILFSFLVKGFEACDVDETESTCSLSAMLLTVQ